jgi:hypothetical protein
MGSSRSPRTGSRAGQLSRRHWGGASARGAAAWSVSTALLVQLAGASSASPQQLHYESPTRVSPSRFEVDSEAKQPLHTLWESSTTAGAERVACISLDVHRPLLATTVVRDGSYPHRIVQRTAPLPEFLRGRSRGDDALVAALDG